jgi:hypothetical protein
MFGIKKQEKPEATKTEILPGPKIITGIVEKYFVNEQKWNPEMLGIINMVIRKSPRSEKAFDCRVFDPSQTEAIELKVKDYTSLDAHPELIAYDGWFDEASRQVELAEKRKISFDTPLFTEAEIRQKIEALREPGSTVFFYQARGPAIGGPLGRGAAVIELNPNGADKKSKKYSVYTVNVIGTGPAAKKQKLFDSNKAEEIAKWVLNAHHKRLY